MRLITASWAAFAATASASAVGHVFIYDGEATVRSTTTTTPKTIDPATARLILANRLDLSQFHSIAEAPEEAIQHVNDFGGRMQELFSNSHDEDERSRVMIVVEGVREPLIPALTEFSSFFVSPAPHPTDSFQLYSTFSAEAASTPFTAGPDASTLRILAPLSEMKVNFLHTYNNRRTLLYVKSIVASASKDHTDQLQTLTAVITNLYNHAKASPLTLSIMFMPPSNLCSKRSTNAYQIQARNAERAEPEKLLSGAAPSVAMAKSSTKSSSTSSASTAPTKSRVIKGPVPTCFASQSSCERGTNNCTGHGSCIRKWKGPSEGGKANDCYGCMCTIPEVRKNADGSQKTTTFGGAACHKKDVVMPLWLLGSTSVFLILIVSWGIGLLYAMGSEELPSVIGAGVSGPAKK